MEMHSYAKRRIPKKWTIEQKRKLVKARIAHDAWFNNKPSSVVPWKNILITTKLDDFNVFFVRKQWSNMLTRYKQYKQTRLGSNIASKAIEAELIKRISQEWEFFEPIHTFMTRKTTNLHSYALTHRSGNNNREQQLTGEVLQQTSATTEEEDHHHHQTNKLLSNEMITINSPKDCIKENIPNNTTIAIQSNNISQEDGIHLFSSDTSNEFQVIAETTRILNASIEPQSMEYEEDENMNCVRNTDHDFYSKRHSLRDIARVIKSNEDELQEQLSNYFADASEGSQGSLNIINTTDAESNGKIANDSTFPDIEIKLENKSRCVESAALEIKEERSDAEFLNNMPSTSTQSTKKHNKTNQRMVTKPRLSERDKYYRHKRHFNRRMEKRFDAFLQIVCHIAKIKSANDDATLLEGTVTSLASDLAKMITSESEDDSQSDDNNTN